MLVAAIGSGAVAVIPVPASLRLPPFVPSNTFSLCTCKRDSHRFDVCGLEMGEFLKLIEETISSFPNVDSRRFVVVDDTLVKGRVDASEKVVDMFEVGFELELTSSERE